MADRWRRTCVGFEKEGAVVFDPRMTGETADWLWCRWKCYWSAINASGRLECGRRGANIATDAIRIAKTAASWARRRQ